MRLNKVVAVSCNKDASAAGGGAEDSIKGKLRAVIKIQSVVRGHQVRIEQKINHWINGLKNNDPNDVLFEIVNGKTKGPDGVSLFSTIRYLINNEADITRQDKYGLTPLRGAVIRENINLVRTLVELGADVNKPKNNGDPPLYRAVLDANINLIELLVSEGANTQYLEDNDNERFELYKDTIKKGQSLYEDKQKNKKTIIQYLNRDLTRNLELKVKLTKGEYEGESKGKYSRLGENHMGLIGKFLGPEVSHKLATLLNPNSKKYKETTKLLSDARDIILKEDENGTTPIPGRFKNKVMAMDSRLKSLSEELKNPIINSEGLAAAAA